MTRGYRLPVAALASVMVLAPACARAQGEGCPALERLLAREQYTIYSSHGDAAVAGEVARVLDAQIPRLESAYEQPLRHHVRVDVLPSQPCYDRAVENPSLRGSPASSGAWRVRLVAPDAPIHIAGLSRADRLQLAPHEFAHLLLNEIGPVPAWLEEGVPTYDSSAEFYRGICRAHLGTRIAIPDFTRLRDSYASVPAADVLAFTAVDWIVRRFGRARLNRLLRAPADLPAALGVSLETFDAEWRQFAATAYRGSSHP